MAITKHLTDAEIHEALCDIDENTKGISAWESDLIEEMVFEWGGQYTELQRSRALEMIEAYWQG